MQSAVGRALLRAGCAAGALVVLGLAAIAGTNAWVAHAANGRGYASTAAVPARSVAIVPGARVYKGKPYVHLEARLQMALSLYQAGRVKAILVSGNETSETPEVAAMTAWLLERGVARKDILADEGGSRTRETMNRAAEAYDVHDAVICTQDVNVARSVYLAEQAGIDAVAVGAPSNLSRSSRWVATEALKTTLAFFESLLA
jgi:vancomycin permeability regulator SanA